MSVIFILILYKFFLVTNHILKLYYENSFREVCIVDTINDIIKSELNDFKETDIINLPPV
jgi:hypothetical protein